ncbi:hypothetical protein HHK36_024783 [Tetracentron sinense]|uniref:SHSP domain-containing protein n=1 Tax=Tetracentron sinense TaxID=13715 RepID=A0A835D4F1_TETSI|nr:hypothetical protein HHK36_024783 [Tetracentron sinense]
MAAGISKPIMINFRAKAEDEINILINPRQQRTQVLFDNDSEREPTPAAFMPENSSEATPIAAEILPTAVEATDAAARSPRRIRKRPAWMEDYESQRFTTTILKNILYRKPKATGEVEAIAASNACCFITLLPNGSSFLLEGKRNLTLYHKAVVTRGRRWTGERSDSRKLTYEDFQPSFDWTHESNCHVLLVDLPGFKKEEVKLQVDNLGKVTVSGERRITYSRYSRFKKEFSVPEDSDIGKISGKFEGGLLFVIIPKKAIERVEEYKEENVSAKKVEEKNIQGKPSIEENPKKATKREEEPKKEKESAINIEEDTKQKISNNEENPKKEDIKNDLGHGIRDERKGESERYSVKEGWNRVRGMKTEKEGLEVGTMESVIEKISKNKQVLITAVLAFSLGFYLSRKLQSTGE